MTDPFATPTATPSATNVTSESGTPSAPAPGWYADPGGAPAYRWWDGTQWTAALQPVPGADWRPLKGLSRAAAAALAFAAAAHVFAVGAFRHRIATIDRMFVDSAITSDDVSTSDTLVAVSVIATALAAILAGILFIVWLQTAYVDAGKLRRTRYNRVWAVVGWFVPVMSLFRPKQVVNDVWMAGDEKYDAHTTPSVSPLLLAWWAAWLLGTAAMSAGYSMSSSAGTDTDPLDTLHTAARVESVAHSLLAIAAILALLVALRATGRLERRQSARSAPPSTGTTQPVT